MRFPRLVVLVAVVSAAAPAAEAAPHKTGQSPAEVRAYWTSERMKHATPRVAAKGGKTTTAKASSSFTTFQPTSSLLTTQPVSTNGKVFFTLGGVNYVCSGTAVTSANQSVVWTAGHCVNEGPGAYATNFAFVPAYSDNNRPYGTWPAVALDTTTAWRTSGQFGKDVGAAVVAPNPAGVRLTAAVGARPMAFNTTRNQDYLAHGYPASGKFNGQRLWVSDTRWARNDTSTSPATMGIPTDLNGGSSGGGWVAGNDYRSAAAPLVSVNSYTYRGLKNTMFGPYLENLAGSADDAYDLLTRAGAVSPVP